MNEYGELRQEIIRLGESTVGAMDAQNRLTQAHQEQIAKLWEDNAELRDELHAVANRLEALTRGLTTEPAETAARMVDFPPRFQRPNSESQS